MDFSIEKQEDETRTEIELPDVSFMQGLQDRFCEANNLYLVCLSRKRGVITKAYGSAEELEYIHQFVGMDKHASLLGKMIGNDIESVVEEDCDTDFVKMCGVSVSINGETEAIWVVVGIIDTTGESVPSFMMKTDEERFYKSIQFLETISREIYSVKMEEISAQKAVLKSQKSQSKMEAELRRSEVVTSIVKMLESEQSFTAVVDDILKEVCEYLKISNGSLLQENLNENTVGMVCEYKFGNIEKKIDKYQKIPKESIPFFNGKPYMISANSMMPEAFVHFFEKEKIKAGVFLPLEVNGRLSMYLCLCEKEKERVWEMSDIKFINDVKRIIQSILIKRIAKNSLASSYASLEAILENVGCGIYVKDPKTGVIYYRNQKLQSCFKRLVDQGRLAQEEPVGTKEDVYKEIYCEAENRWFDYHCMNIKWVDGRNVILCTIYDVTDKKMYQQKIERQANNDFLTGLLNRMRCEQDLERCIQESQESGGEGALLYLDLDDFKHINDGLGHQYGDILLKNIATSLQKITGVESYCYRMGGDEFVILLSGHRYKMLSHVIEEIRTIFTKPWLLKGADYYCTMSMGIVKFPTDGDNVDDLIKKADIALYDAKCAGKNRIAFYDDKVESTSFKRLDLEKNMRNATKNNFSEFEVYFQPVVDVTLPGNPCTGAEALIRWNSPELGFVSPVEFIPLAEYLGLINPIGDFVLREACKHCKYWNDLGHPEYKVNVNLSVVQLLQNDIVAKIQRTIEEIGMIPENLTLEVTESLGINDMNRMKQILAEIRKLGVRVALDDFGTGYSSLNHIREMPIDVIKIDRCFIVDIGKDNFSNAFVKMVAELANTIGVKVCVEGIENEEQIHVLKESRIQLIQGYYFDKPMPAEEFELKYLS